MKAGKEIAFEDRALQARSRKVSGGGRTAWAAPDDADVNVYV